MSRLASSSILCPSYGHEKKKNVMRHSAMTPPLKSNSEPMDRSRKRVEWSNNISSESAPPEERGNPAWDSETDHLLSYFLSDPHNHNETATPTQFTTGGNHSSHNSHNSSNNTNNTNSQTNPSSRPQSSGSLHASSFASRNPDAMYDDEPLQPPTPAIYYYHHAPKPPPHAPQNQHHQIVPHPPRPSGPSTFDSRIQPQTSTSPSSSSIASITASLVSGGPFMRHQLLRNNNMSQDSLEGMSPISPAAMIGTGQEPLMLPSTDISPLTTRQLLQQQHQQQHQQSHGGANANHLAWLQEINAYAKASNENGNMVPPPAALPQHPHPSSMSVIPGYPHPMNAMFYAQAHSILQSAATPGESEEKRARRLERNRESARKSRRRKKERLAQLEEKVAHLYSQIEVERRSQINVMDKILLDYQETRIAEFRTQHQGTADANEELNQQLATLVEMTGPNCPVRKAVVDFQYTVLQQFLLPKYQKFLVWLTLHSEAYFLAGKELHAQREPKQVVRVTAGKVSSKQIGDELTNGRKTEDGKYIPPEGGGEKGQCLTSQAFDASRVWPLLCFELSISVDQEERFLQAHKRVQQLEHLPNTRTQIDAATRMAENLKEAVLYQSHAASIRAKRSYLEVLTPRQTILYQEWLSNKNRERLSEVMKRRRARSSSFEADNNPCLMDVCRKLEEILRISKQGE